MKMAPSGKQLDKTTIWSHGMRCFDKCRAKKSSFNTNLDVKNVFICTNTKLSKMSLLYIWMHFIKRRSNAQLNRIRSCKDKDKDKVNKEASLQRCSQVIFCKSKSSLKSLSESPSQVSSLWGSSPSQVSSLWLRVQVKFQVSRKH